MEGVMERYARQIILPEIGDEGQRRLKEAKVLVVGAGGLGSPIAIYLASVGVGCIGIVDNDCVSISNLNRQILYNEDDIGKLKVEAAASKLKVIPYNLRLDRENASDIFSHYDIIIDASDNPQTRYAISDVSAMLGKPFIYGAICGFEGQLSVFNYGDEPKSYRDLWPDEELVLQMDVEKGAIGTTAGIVGILQVNEAVKIICGVDGVLAGKLFTINLKTLYTAVLSL